MLNPFDTSRLLLCHQCFGGGRLRSLNGTQLYSTVHITHDVERGLFVQQKLVRMSQSLLTLMYTYRQTVIYVYIQPLQPHVAALCGLYFSLASPSSPPHLRPLMIMLCGFINRNNVISIQAHTQTQFSFEMNALPQRVSTMIHIYIYIYVRE